MSKPRDVVVVRVSEKGDREDEHFHSPEVQIGAARRWARDRGERLVASPIPEIDVSGRLPLSKRPGLLAGIEMIEAGRADQLLVADFDRLGPSAQEPPEEHQRVAENGIERAISGVAWMLRSRMYLGEIHFGELHNTRAHEAIVKDRGLFERVRRRTVSRGRQAKSERLLARLGVLRCGTCGSRMVINSYSGSYRCAIRARTGARRGRPAKANRAREIVLDAVRAYSATADAP